jgi:hypothetical protein
MKTVIISLALIGTRAQALPPKPSSEHLICPSQYADCIYLCPGKNFYGKNCEAMSGTQCRSAENIIRIIPSGETRGWIVAFHIDTQLPDLLCIEETARKR